jgi:LacI family transcriptional regulator
LVAKREIRCLQERGVPLVVLGWVDDAEEVDLVACDDAAGGYALARHLIALGHRRITQIGPKVCRGPYDRARGFQRALEEAGLFTPDSFYSDVYTERGMREAISTLLRRPNPPTALFAFNDAQATWALSCLAEAGVAVPGEMAVVGFGDIDLAAHLNPRLTTVAYPVQAIGEGAVSLLMNRIGGKADAAEPQRLMLTPRLIVRQSCGAGLLALAGRR